MNNFDEINNFFMNNNLNSIGIFVNLTWKVSMRWKNWCDFKGPHSMKFREKDWSKIETLSLNSQPRFSNFRMKFIVWMIREILEMLSRYAVDYPTYPVNQRYFHLIVILEGCWAVLGECWAATISRQIFGNTHGLSGNVFVNPPASSSSPYPQESNPWISNVSEHTSPHVTSERKTPDTALDPRCQSGPSARNSVIPSEGGFSKTYGADQQWLQISDPDFDKILHVSNVRLLEDEIQYWGTYLFTISYGSSAVDQRSGVGLFSGWSKIFVFCKRNSNARFWSTRCEDCFSTE